MQGKGDGGISEGDKAKRVVGGQRVEERGKGEEDVDVEVGESEMKLRR